MKKIVGIIAALALAGSVFAGEPSVSPVIAEFKGDASLEWIANLDDETIGMKNTQNANFKVTFISEGTKETTGEGLWGELQIKEEASDTNATLSSGGSGITVKSPKVEKAIIHFVDDDFYASMDIKGPDLSIGGGKYVIATRSDNNAWANPSQNANGVGLPGPAQGFKINFGLKDLFDANFSFADDGQDKVDTKDFAFKFDGTLKAVENLEVYGGVAYSTFEEKVALAAKASYKLGITDTLYVRPSVGFALKDKAKALGAALLIGWGAENIDSDFTEEFSFEPGKKQIPKKFTDGFSFALTSNLESKDKGGKMDFIVGLYDSTFVPGLKFAADFRGDFYSLDKQWDLDAAVKYSNTFDIWTIDANFGLRVMTRTVLETKTKAGFLYGFGVSTDNSFIQNTKLYVKYAGEHAEDIGAAKNKKGTVTVGTQIHF